MADPVIDALIQSRTRSIARIDAQIASLNRLADSNPGVAGAAFRAEVRTKVARRQLLVEQLAAFQGAAGDPRQLQLDPADPRAAKGAGGVDKGPAKR